MGSESIAREAEGRMGYSLRGHEGERNNSTWSYENRVSKHFVIFLNLPCLILWLGICVEVDVTTPLPIFSLPTILSLTQVTVISLKSAGA